MYSLSDTLKTLVEDKREKVDKYKLLPIIYNLFAFFEEYFPSLCFERDITIEKKLNILFNFLDTDNLFQPKHFITGYFTSDKIYEETLIKIYINGNNIYDWQLYQYYENLNNLKGKLITGYSELKYSYYLNKFS